VIYLAVTMEPEQFKAICQVLHAALDATSARLRDFPRPDPEIYPVPIEEEALDAAYLPKGPEGARP
jgi:hypothetical protein